MCDTSVCDTVVVLSSGRSWQPVGYCAMKSVMSYVVLLHDGAAVDSAGREGLVSIATHNGPRVNDENKENNYVKTQRSAAPRTDSTVLFSIYSTL